MFAQLLQRSGLTTGPFSGSNTSHSAMGAIKLFLMGERPSVFPEIYLIFGNTLHLCCLTGSRNFGKIDTQKAVNMTENFRAHPVVRSLMEKAIVEKKRYAVINGVMISLILDIEQPHVRRASDLKTTTAKSLREFIEKAIELDYFRQGETYIIARKLDDFFFIGLGKNPPHSIFIFSVNEYPEEREYAREELALLLYWHKTYGKPLWK